MPDDLTALEANLGDEEPAGGGRHLQPHEAADLAVQPHLQPARVLEDPVSGGGQSQGGAGELCAVYGEIQTGALEHLRKAGVYADLHGSDIDAQLRVKSDIVGGALKGYQELRLALPTKCHHYNPWNGC